MGGDIVLSQIIKEAMKSVEGIYDILVHIPSSTLTISATEFPNIGTITVETIGTTNG